MRDPARRHPTVTRWRTLVVVAVAAAMLAGCDLATGTVRTATELQRAGIDNPNLNYDGGTATLHYDADPNALDARAEQDQAAAIIWRNLPFRIERIVITSDSGAFPTQRVYTRDQLEQELGPRPANLDRSVADIARRATLIAGVVALVVLVLIVLVIVLVVRAVRRRPPAQPAPAWPQAPPGSQPWGQQGWTQPGPPPQPQQGWGQPPPPGQQGPPPGQQPWGSQPGYGQPPAPAWPEAQPPPQQPPAPAPPPGAAPPRGPGDTQRLEPEPPPDDQRGPAPPVPPA
ncbi:MAG TPA: hypothetical protein VHK02_04030 [Actinomycetota bacterium]|jgi:hypothetical protein|nr:hypothetical protein [Actinomycetota bacterium]